MLKPKLITDKIMCPYLIWYNKDGERELDVYFRRAIDNCFKYGNHSLFYNKIVPLYNMYICIHNGFKTHFCL